MKKIISVLIITALMVSMMSVMAFARCGGYRRGGEGVQQSQYSVCTVDNCAVAGPHQHGGVWYCSQICGQDNYDVCPVAGCAELGLHEHDGIYYRCASHGMGRGCGRWQSQ